MMRQFARRVTLLTLLAYIIPRCNCSVERNENEHQFEPTAKAFNRRKRVLKRNIGKQSIAGLLDQDLVDQYEEMFENAHFSMSIISASTTTTKSSKKSKRRSYDIPLEHFHISHHHNLSNESSKKGSKKSSSLRGGPRLTHSSRSASTQSGEYSS
jgi:hypothetical protein